MERLGPTEYPRDHAQDPRRQEYVKTLSIAPWEGPHTLMPRQERVLQGRERAPVLQIREGHRHIVRIVAPATVIKVDGAHLLTVKHIVPLVQIRMDKPKHVSAFS